MGCLQPKTEFRQSAVTLLATVLCSAMLTGCTTSVSPVTTISGSMAATGERNGLRINPRQSAKLEAWHDATHLSSLDPDRASVAGAGESMAPVFDDDTILVITKAQFQDLEPGMKVAYLSRDGRQVVHQLVDRSPDGWRVRGINNGEVDSERVTARNLLGVVYASLDATVASIVKQAGEKAVSKPGPLE